MRDRRKTVDRQLKKKKRARALNSMPIGGMAR